MRGVVELARSHSPEAIRTLQSMRNDEASPAARVAAANAILDRGYGKPKETVDANVRTSWEIWCSPQWEGRASSLHSRARTAGLPVAASKRRRITPALSRRDGLAVPLVAW
jgi:hypothetical protein